MNVPSRKLSAVRWFAGFGVYIAALALLAYRAGARGDSGLKDLIIFIIFVSFACQFLPMPIIPAFLAISRHHNPFLVALLGSCATCIANLHDYYILTSLMRLERLRRAKETHWYRRAAEWFGKYPFLTLAAANFLPLPVDVPRLLAISTRYRRPLYVLSTFAGRYPRYLILAFAGHELKLSNTVILVILAATLIPAAVKALPRLRERVRGGRGEGGR